MILSPCSFQSSTIRIDFANSECNSALISGVASDLRVSWADDDCQSAAAADDEVKKINIFLGAPCDYATGRLGSLVQYWNWPLFLSGAR